VRINLLIACASYGSLDIVGWYFYIDQKVILVHPPLDDAKVIECNPQLKFMGSELSKISECIIDYI
jgi:hypothetical protein